MIDDSSQATQSPPKPAGYERRRLNAVRHGMLSRTWCTSLLAWKIHEELAGADQAVEIV